MAARLRLIVLLPWLAATTAGAVDLFGNGEQEFLHPDEAFVLTVTADGAQQLRAHFRIAEGYYLYRDKTAFADLQGAQFEDYRLPPGQVRDDPLFGKVQTWSGDVAVDLKLAAPAHAVVLEARYQGCAEKGVCYPLQTRAVPVSLDSSAAPPPAGGADGMLSRSDRIARDLAEETLGWSFLVFLGFGLLLAFTPCVLPMIPILAGVIAGAEAGTGRAVRLSVVYVLAMASTYALLGVVIGQTGANLQAYLQNPWVIGGFVLVLLLLAMSMFGMYEFQMSAALHNRLHRLGQSFHNSGSYVGAGIMGFLGALVASPCVSPPLVGALIHIADTGSAARGAISLFGMGLGLGLPLLLFGAFEGRYLPRSGPWMVRVKAVFGFLLLALAIWMLDRIVPGPVTLALSGLLLSTIGLLTGAVDRMAAGAGTAAHLRKGAAMLLLLYGCVLLVGAWSGSSSLLRPLEGFTAAEVRTTASDLDFRPIKTTRDLHRELDAAKGKPVLLDFYADWCVTCKELEAFTFPDPEVQARMKRFVLLKADVTKHDEHDQELLESLGLFGPPAILFYAADGEELRGFRTVSYVPAEKFAAELDQILGFAESGF